MKKVLGIFTIGAFAIACNQAPDPAAIQSANQPAFDTSGLAAFQAWKAQGELQQLNDMNAEANAPRTVERHYYYNNGTRTASRSSSARSSSGSRSSGTASRGSSGSSGSTAKKGWSKAAKGAVIGGVAGGAAGAVINKKNRVAGGAVGAVVGAAGGYILGRQMDKKDGRVN